MLTAQARVLLPRAYIKPRHGSDMFRSLSTDEAETGDSEGLSLVSDGRGSMAERMLSICKVLGTIFNATLQTQSGPA